MSKTIRKTDGKMKRKEMREMGQRGKTELLLIAKERDWGLSI